MAETELVGWFAKNVKEIIPSLDISLVKREGKTKDRMADIIVKTKDNEQILIEVKSSGEPTYLFRAISQLKYCKTDEINYLMVAVPKITEKGKAICKSLGVGYMDMQGSVFIKFKDKLIDRGASYKVLKQFKKEKKRVKKIFSRDSLKFFITMLNNPNEWFTQEELSVKTGVSKGYINRILKTLESGVKADSNILVFEGPKNRERINKNIPGLVVIGEADWKELPSKKKTKISVVKKTIQYKITNPSKLLDIISNQYEFSKNKIVSLYSFEKDPYKLIRKIGKKSRELKLNYALTMHAGASQIAPFVRFEDVYFYVRNDDIPKWIGALDLKQTELGGNVFLVAPQDEWILKQTQTANNLKISNNVQLYIDLINYPKRGKEQAEFLRKEKIGF